MAHMPPIDGPNIASALTCVDVTSPDYDGGARGDAVTDDHDALAEAITAAATLGIPLVLPYGRTYLLGSSITDVPGDLHIIGQGSTIKFDSTSFKALQFADDASRVTIEGVTFEGNTSVSDYNVNQHEAMYFVSDNVDVTIRGCTFSWCRPNVFGGNSGMDTGRFLMADCRMLNCVLPVSMPGNGELRDCWFWNDDLLLTRSHGVYVFSRAEGTIISGCHFKNIDGNAIKFNNASARYDHKRSLVISGCKFTGGGTQAIWIGSDGDAIVTGASITGNEFRNTKQVEFHNLSDGSFTGNTMTWDWETEGAAGSVTAAIVVSSAIASGPMSPGRNLNISGNTCAQRHPFVGKITFSAAPAADTTITVGAVTYTWKASAASATQLQVQLSAAAAAEQVRNVLRGSRTSPATSVMNVVLRGPQDAFYEDTVLVIASDATFTLSTSGAGMTVTAVADKRVCTSAVHINDTMNVAVRSNTFENFNWLYVSRSVEPVIEENTLIDCVIDAHYNIEGKYKNNTITWNRARSAPRAGQTTNLQIRVSDFMPVISGNGLIRDQQYTCPQMLGASGVVTVSDGQAHRDLYYGSEAVTDTAPESLPFRWNDGDTVVLVSHVPTTYTCTFKRSSPGANEFNSAASLMTWIGNLGGGTVFGASFVPTSGGASDDVWIRITYQAAGTNGNNAYLQVTTRSQTCGRVLLDADADAPNNTRAYFRGGTATTGGLEATKTWCWSQLANPATPPIVQGLTADAHDLAPVVFPVDIVNGVGFYISHLPSAAGDEEFYWQIGGA